MTFSIFKLTKRLVKSWLVLKEEWDFGKRISKANGLTIMIPNAKDLLNNYNILIIPRFYMF